MNKEMTFVDFLRLDPDLLPGQLRNGPAHTSEAPDV